MIGPAECSRCATQAQHRAQVHANAGLAAQFDLRRLGILGDAGEHMDFSRLLYITDTGGIYGSPANVRDRVKGRNWMTPTPPRELAERLHPKMEPLVLLSSHPERWPARRVEVLVQSGLDTVVNGLKRFRTIQTASS